MSVIYTGPAFLRLLGTASRNWRDLKVIWDDCEFAHVAAREQCKTLVVVHGDADGGDMVFKLYAQVHPDVLGEPHPANWDGLCCGTCKPDHRKKRKDGTEFCPAAGVRRNQDMVDLGADLGSACIRDRSPGASDCYRRMNKAGIPTRMHTYSTPRCNTTLRLEELI